MWYSAVGFLVTLTLSLLATPLTANAQAPAKVPRIGVLSSASPPATSVPSPFVQGLRDLGYVEGKNIAFESRYAEGNLDRLPDLAAELVRLQVDVIVAGGTAAIRAAQHATRTIPIVMAVAYDPVGEGLVASLARPGGNVTGLSWLGAELPGKRLEFLKETVPQLTRIAVLANPANPAYKPVMNNLTGAAQALGLQLHVVEVRRADELDTAFTAMSRVGTEALIVQEDSLLFSGLRRQITELAAKNRLPAMYGWKYYVDAGGLMSYGPSQPDMLRRAATYVDKILKGAKPGDLPVEQPTKFELIINVKTAKALGLTIPATLLFQADEVIQ